MVGNHYLDGPIEVKSGYYRQMSRRGHKTKGWWRIMMTAVILTFLWMSFPIKVFGFLPFPTGYPRSNLRRNWLSVKFAWQDTFEAQRAASLPRYYRPGNVSLPEIFVVSLKTASDRRECVQQQMTEQKIPFKWWDAVDGTQHMPEDEIRWHLSGSRLKSYFKSPQGSRDWRKAACDLSHLRLMHDMIASGRDVQVVLEDDVQLVTDFEARLKAALAALPADWDVLWLNHGRPIQRNPNNLSGWVGPGLRLFRDNSGTVGMVYRRSFAFVMLNDAQIGNKPIDNAMNDAGQLGRVKAYVADPPLVRVHEAGFPSTIDVELEHMDGMFHSDSKSLFKRGCQHSVVSLW